MGKFHLDQQSVRISKQIPSSPRLMMTDFMDVVVHLVNGVHGAGTLGERTRAFVQFKAGWMTALQSREA